MRWCKSGMPRLLVLAFVVAFVVAFVAAVLSKRALLFFTIEGFGAENLTNFGLALPAGPVFLVKLHETLGALNCLFLRFQFKNREPSDDFLGLGERPVDRVYLSARKPDARTLCNRRKAAACYQIAGFLRLFTKLRHRVQEFFGRRSLNFTVLDQHHESHRHISFWVRREIRSNLHILRSHLAH